MKNADRNKRAIALQYGDNDIAPRIVSQARGELADSMVEIALKHKVPVLKDEKVVDAVFYMPEGAFIPPEAYEVVAKIYVFIRKIERKLQR